ncbi:MAG: hemin uptake protein HemP [Burkholderiales bacterium]
MCKQRRSVPRMLRIGDPMSTINPELRYPQPSAAYIAPKITSEQLMQGKREIIIQHVLQEYRLRITASGKLILTK